MSSTQPLTIQSIETIIKWSMLELSTNLSIDHRNYSYTKKVKLSPLVKIISENNFNFDQGINALAKIISEDVEFVSSQETLGELHNNDTSELDENADEIYDEEMNLFNRFIELSGLYEIESLHTDSAEKFKNYLFSKVYI